MPRILLTFVGLILISVSSFAQTSDRNKVLSEIQKLRQEIKTKIPLLLAPAESDKEEFKDFLNQPNTGLIRLLPREKYDWGELTIRGGGAYYSFARKSQEYGISNDIELQQNKFSVGFAGADYGFILNLGDLPLEKVSTETNGVDYMANYIATDSEPVAREEYERFREFKSNKFIYQNRIPVEVGKTYALRSINYRCSDVLVAFRVIREDTDGSVILLWKMLKEFPKPDLN